MAFFLIKSLINLVIHYTVLYPIKSKWGWKVRKVDREPENRTWCLQRKASFDKIEGPEPIKRTIAIGSLILFCFSRVNFSVIFIRQNNSNILPKIKIRWNFLSVYWNTFGKYFVKIVEFKFNFILSPGVL